MDLRESRTSRGVRHPWERARFAFLEAVLRRHGRLAAESVLDVGSGDAWLASELLRALPESTRIDCVDASYDAAVVSALDLPSRITAHSEIPGGRFDLVTALDVAEHVQDDAGFLRELRARVAPGGALLFTVPAWPRLYSAHDRALGHHRRYTRSSARSLLERSGMRIVEDGCFFHSLLLPRIAARASESIRAPRDAAVDTAWRFGERAGSVVTRVLVAEQRLTHALAIRGLFLPGLSYYALAVPA